MSQGMIKLSWNTIHEAMESLMFQLTPHKPLGIIGVARGGLIPATMLSHKLDVQLLTINAKSYGKDNQQRDMVELDIHDNVFREVNANPARWVFVDDILDSGSTHDALRTRFPISMYAVVVTKRSVLPILHYAYVPQGIWVEFPWE